MLKKQLFVSVFSLFAILVNAQRIDFQNYSSWEETIENAKQTGKFIFVYTHCVKTRSCENMEESAFTDPAIGQFINTYFVSVRVQIDSSMNDSDQTRRWYKTAAGFLDQANITFCPTILFFSPQGILVHKIKGCRDTAQLLATARAALDSSKQYYTRISSFNKGNNRFEFVEELVKKASAEGDTAIANIIAAEYIRRLPEHKVFTTNNLFFIANHCGLKSEAFKVFQDESPKVDSVLGNGQALRLFRYGIFSFYSKSIINDRMFENSRPDFRKTEKEMWELYANLGKKEFLRLKALYYFLKFQKFNRAAADLNAWFSVKKQLYSMYPEELDFEGARILNNDAWFLFQHAEDRKQLNSALEWSKKAIDMEPTVGNWRDTYANLLYKLGRTEEAIKVQEKALELEPSNDAIKQNLRKMKGG